MVPLLKLQKKTCHFEIPLCDFLRPISQIVGFISCQWIDGKHYQWLTNENERKLGVFHGLVAWGSLSRFWYSLSIRPNTTKFLEVILKIKAWRIMPSNSPRFRGTCDKKLIGFLPSTPFKDEGILAPFSHESIPSNTCLNLFGTQYIQYVAEL